MQRGALATGCAGVTRQEASPAGVWERRAFEPSETDRECPPVSGYRCHSAVPGNLRPLRVLVVIFETISVDRPQGEDRHSTKTNYAN